MQGDLNGARELARRAVKQRPNSAAAHAALAEAQIFAGDTTAAADHIDRSGRLAPLDLGRIAWLLGLANLADDDTAAAARHFAVAAKRHALRADLASALAETLTDGALPPRADPQALARRLPFQVNAPLERLGLGRPVKP